MCIASKKRYDVSFTLLTTLTNNNTYTRENRSTLTTYLCDPQCYEMKSKTAIKR